MAPTINCFKPKPFIPIPQFKFPNGQPETDTIYKLSFIPNCGYNTRPELIKPISNFRLCEDDYMDTNTVYKNSFQKFQTTEKSLPIHHTNNLSTSKERPESCTVYKLSYIGNLIGDRPPPIRPKSNLDWKTDLPFDCTTINRESYVAQPICKNEPIIHQGNLKTPQVKIDCGTVYNLSYVPVRGGRPESFKPQVQYQRPYDPMDTNTTHKMSFKEHSININDRPMPFKPISEFSLFGNGDFVCDTIYKNSYRMVQGERPAPIRHQSNLTGSQDRPESCTVYKLSYEPCEGYTRAQPIRHEANLQTNPNSPFYCTSTQKQDFVPLPYYGREPIMYKHDNLKTEGCVEKNTVYKLSYLPTKNECRPSPFKPINQFKTPNGKFENNTTYNLSYFKSDLAWSARPDPIRPESNFKISNEDEGCVDYNTIYKNSYYPVQSQRSIPIKHANNLTTSNEKPESCTVYKLSYVPNQCIQRSAPIRPKENKWTSDNDQFECYTTSKLSYVAHPCSKVQQPIRPDRESQIRWTGPVDQKTVYDLSYMPVRPELVTPFKPQSHYERPNEPIQTDTTYKKSFTPCVIPEMQMPIIRKDNFERPIGPMETATIQKLSYLPPCAVQA